MSYMVEFIEIRNNGFAGIENVLFLKVQLTTWNSSIYEINTD